MNLYRVKTYVQNTSCWQPIKIGVADHWEKHARPQPSTSSAKLYVQASGAIVLRGLRLVASVLEGEDFDVLADC